MGGYFCGGQNKTHDCTTEHIRLDSFSFALGKFIPLMEKKGLKQFTHSVSWTNGNSIGVVVYPERLELRYTAGPDGGRERITKSIYLDAVENNYGGPPRIYFLCPCCGRRCRMLYLHRLHFKCRQCARLNYYSQQVTKGDDEAAYRMRQFIREKFKVKESLSPAEAESYWPDRPKGMHWKTYSRLMQELQVLQEEYARAWLAHAYRVIGWALPGG